MQELKEASSEQIQRDRWEEETLRPALNRQPERKSSFQTVSLDQINGRIVMRCDRWLRIHRRLLLVAVTMLLNYIARRAYALRHKLLL